MFSLRFLNETLDVIFLLSFIVTGDAVSLLIGHRNCDSQVAGSSPCRAPLRSGLGQANYTCVVPPSPSSIIFVLTEEQLCYSVGKVSTRLVGSNGVYDY